MKRPPIKTAADIEVAQTGRTMDAAAFEKACKERDTLEKQTAWIAKRLESVGIRTTTGRFAIVGLLSLETAEKTQYRNLNLLPSVQARNTHGTMLAVQYWLDSQKPNSTRMWVISGGWVPLFCYRDAHQALTRQISKLASDKRLKEYGIELSYYSIENTIHRENGLAMLNLHAHVLVKTTRYIGEHGWRFVMDHVRRQFDKGYVHDSPIRRAAEAVKYCFKPAEFRELTDVELAALANAVKGLRFHTPLGDFREFRRSLKDDGLKLKRLATDDGAEWCLVKVNSRDQDDKERPGGPFSNMPVGITTPAPVFNATMEPCVIVKDFTTLEALFALNPWLEERRRALEATAARVAARQAERLSSIRDTTTTTVLAAPSEMDTDPAWWIPPGFGDVAEWHEEAAIDEFEGLDHPAAAWI